MSASDSPFPNTIVSNNNTQDENGVVQLNAEEIKNANQQDPMDISGDVPMDDFGHENDNNCISSLQDNDDMNMDQNSYMNDSLNVELHKEMINEMNVDIKPLSNRSLHEDPIMKPLTESNFGSNVEMINLEDNESNMIPNEGPRKVFHKEIIDTKNIEDGNQNSTVQKGGKKNSKDNKKSTITNFDEMPITKAVNIDDMAAKSSFQPNISIGDNIDEAPIQSSKSQFELMLEKALAEDPSSLPPNSTLEPNSMQGVNTERALGDDLNSNLRSKNIAVRRETIQRLRDQVESGSQVDLNDEAIGALINEKNVLLQEQAVQILQHYLQKHPSQISALFSHVKYMVQKLLSSNKENTKNATMELLRMCVGKGMIEPVIQHLIQASKSKMPKLRFTSIHMLNIAFRIATPPSNQLKSILNNLTTWFEDSDEEVRKETTELACTIHKVIGPQIQPFIKSIRPSQLEILNTRFSEVSDSMEVEPTQTSITDSSSASFPNEITPMEDIYDLVEPVSVLENIPKSLEEDLANKKWMIRNESLQKILKFAEQPKLQKGDYTVLITKLLKVITKDIHNQVVKTAVAIIGHLAKVGPSIASDMKPAVSVLLGKFKKLGAGLSDALHTALDQIEAGCLSLSDCKNEIISSCKSPSPQVRIHALQWVDRRIVVTNGKLSNILPVLAQTLCSLTGDANQQIRDLACQALGKLMWRLGEKQVLPHIAKLDKIFQDKVKENYFVVSGNTPQKPEDTTSSQTETRSHSKMAPPTRPKSQPKSRPKSRSRDNTPAPSPKSNTVKLSAKKSNITPTILPSISKDSALIEGESLIPEPIRAKLSDSQWKIRLEGIQEFKEYLQTLGKEICPNVAVYIRYLEQYPGFTDSNIHVLSVTFECLELIAKEAGTFKPSAAVTAIPFLVDKLSQAKVKTNAASCLTAFCQYTNPQFVLSTSYPDILKQKNPKTIVEGLIWVKNVISSFGVSLIEISGLITFLKSCLENSNPQVKDAAIEVFIALKKCGVQNILDMISDIKPVLLTKITSQLQSVQVESNFEPALEIKGEIPEELKNLTQSSQEPVDISSYLSNILKDADSPSWKARLSSVEAIQDILKQANYNIAPNILPLFRILKQLLDDTNIKIVVESLKLLDGLGKSLGQSGEKFNKIIMQTLISKLSNNTRQIRTYALHSLSEWSKNVSFLPLVKYLAKVISNSNAHPEGRKGCMELILKKISQVESRHDLMLMLVSHTILALTDKNPELRKLSETIIGHLIEGLGREVVLNEIPKLNLKPAVLRTIQPVLLRYEKKEEIPLQENETPTSTFNTISIPEIQSHPSPMKRNTSSLFVLNKEKDAREARDEGVHRWNFEPHLRKEMMQSISNLLKNSVSPLLHKQMFSENFQSQVDAISTITENLQIFATEIRQSIDLLYRWISTLILDCNTTLLVKSLDFISKSLRLFEDEPMTDYEASCILPMLIDKMGHNISSVRQRIHSLVREFIPAITPQRLVHFLTVGMKSKSYRSRADSLSLIGQLLKEFGPNVISLPQHLPIICSALDDCEFVKSGATLLIQQIYQTYGDTIADMSIVLKPQHREYLVSKYNIVEKSSVDAMEDIDPANTSQSHTNTTTESLSEEEDIPISDFTLSTPVEDLIAAVDVHPGSEAKNERSIDALKILSNVMHTNKRTFVLKTKLVAQKLTQLITIAFHCAAENSVTPRLPKHILNCIINLFEIKELAGFIQKDDLMQAMEHLLLLLLDSDTIATLEDGKELNRAMNSLVIRILENANRTYMYTVLLNLLSKAASEPNSKQISLIELIVKCLLKITKQLSKTIDKIDIDILLMDVDQFLNSLEGYICPTDLPLRSAKTILSELIKIKGESIRDHLTLIRASKNSPIEKYIQMILSASRADPPVTEPKRKRQRIIGPDDEGEQYNSKLDSIFSMIRVENTCQEGLKELYKFQTLHTDVSIDPWMQQCSEPFQEYIKRQLKKIELHEKGKQQNIDVYASKFKEIQQKYNIKPTEGSVPLFSRPQTAGNTEGGITSFESIREQWKRQKRSSLQSSTTQLDFESLRQRFQSLPKRRSDSITSESPITLEILKKRMEVTSGGITPIPDKENVPHNDV